MFGVKHFRRFSRPLAAVARGLRQFVPALLLCSALTGCASGMPSWMSGWSQSPADQQSQDAADKQGAGPLADFIGASAPGAQGNVSDPAYGAVQVSVAETYVSALGETCRKAVVTGGAHQLPPDQAAACKGADGRWRMLPSLLVPARGPRGQK